MAHASVALGFIGLAAQLSQVLAMPALPSPVKDPAAGSCAAVVGKGKTFLEMTTGDVYEVKPQWDYEDSDIAQTIVSTYAGCFSACSNYFPCVSFAYEGDDNGGTCYLKGESKGGHENDGTCAAVRTLSGTGPRNFTNPATTGASPASTEAPIAGSCRAASAQGSYYTSSAGEKYTLECAHDHNGGDLESVHSDTFIGCTDSCDKTAGCIAYAYTSGTCYLKSTITGDGDNMNVDFAYKGKATPGDNRPVAASSGVPVLSTRTYTTEEVVSTYSTVETTTSASQTLTITYTRPVSSMVTVTITSSTLTPAVHVTDTVSVTATTSATVTATVSAKPHETTTTMDITIASPTGPTTTTTMELATVPLHETTTTWTLKATPSAKPDTLNPSQFSYTASQWFDSLTQPFANSAFETFSHVPNPANTEESVNAVSVRAYMAEAAARRFLAMRGFVEGDDGVFKNVGPKKAAKQMFETFADKHVAMKWVTKMAARHYLNSRLRWSETRPGWWEPKTSSSGLASLGPNPPMYPDPKPTGKLDAQVTKAFRPSELRNAAEMVKSLKGVQVKPDGTVVRPGA